MINTFPLQHETHFGCRAAPSAICISSELIKTYKGGTFTVVRLLTEGLTNLHIFEFELEIS